jgi:hypothetical protein
MFKSVIFHRCIVYSCSRFLIFIDTCALIFTSPYASTLFRPFPSSVLIHLPVRGTASLSLLLLSQGFIVGLSWISLFLLPVSSLVIRQILYGFARIKINRTRLLLCARISLLNFKFWPLLQLFC